MHLKLLLAKKQKAIQEGNEINISKHCLELAEFYKSDGKFTAAIQEYEETLHIYKKQNKHIEAGTIHRAIGEIYSGNLANPKKALVHQLEYLRIAKNEKNILEEQRALATIGSTYFCAATTDNDNDLLERAYKAYIRSLDICKKKLNDQVSDREKIDMQTRLLVNIANVLESKNEIPKAIKYALTAVQIAQLGELFENIQMGLRTLAGLHARQNNFQKALSFYKEAFQVAERLSDNRDDKLCLILMEESEIYLKIADFKSAKQVLVKAHRLKSPNKIDRDTIKQHLKIVTVLCRTEETLLKIPEDDYTQRKVLYEKMGDGICELKYYAVAIDYYKKMLKCVELKPNRTEQELSAAYISLAQTYKDNKQYDLAIEYFQKDLDLFCGKSHEVVENYLNIADVLTLAKKNYDDVEIYIQKARLEAQKARDVKLEEKVLTKLIVAQKKYELHGLVEETKRERRSLVAGTGLIDTDSDSASEENTQSKSMADEINTSDISDSSDPDDNQENIRSRLSRSQRNATCKFKKNPKGETPLHLACIHGDKVRVKALLSQKHPVNVRDHAGWLPLHEACLYGHREIVEMLIRAGAALNDRGGPECKGATPLHDACVNFHLDVVELLLDNGASPLIKNDYNQTALDLLLTIVKDPDGLNESSNFKFNAIVKRLKDALKKAGKLNEFESADLAVASTSKQTLNVSPYTTPDLAVPSTSKQVLNMLPYTSPRKSTDQRNKRLSSNLEMEITAITSPVKYHRTPEKITKQPNRKSPRRLNNSTNSMSSATLEYKKAIEGVRRSYNTPEKTKTITRKLSTSSYLGTNDLDDDDWLVNDIPNEPNRKRKVTNSVNDIDNTLKLKRSKSLTTKKTPVKKLASDSEDIEIITQSHTSIQLDDSDDDFEQSYQSSSSKNQSPQTRKHQTTLLNAGFTRHKSNDLTNSPESRLNHAHDTKINISSPPLNPPDSTTLSLPTQCTNVLNTNLISIDVRIENKMWKIPIPTRNINSLTIAWLAEEASKRYYSKEGVKPNLQLETKEHAILDDNDPLEMVLTYNELYSKVISWNLPSIVERYLDAYENNKSAVNFHLKNCLDQCQATLILNISDLNLTHQQIVPVIKALKHQKTLEELNLSGNSFNDETMKLLCEILPTLNGLQRLNLSCTLITWESISLMSDMFNNNMSRTILPALNTLNFSYNTLGDNCMKFFMNIFKYIKLKWLSLASIALTLNLFQSGCGIINDMSALNLNQIEYLDLSDNQLNANALKIFFQNINACLLKHINLAGVSQTTSGDACVELVNCLRQGTPKYIQHIDLSRCFVDDYNLKELLNSLINVPKLETLNLSDNKNLTGVTFRLLWESKLSFTNLILENCSNICLGLTTDDIIFITQDVATITNVHKRVSTMRIHLQHKLEIDMCTTLWRSIWKDNAIIYQGFHSYFEFTNNNF